MTSVLITSVGRQTDLVRAFKSVLQGQGIMLAADADEDAPGLAEADEGLVSPPWRSPEYIPWVTQVCREHDVALLLTLHESDLAVLEGVREELRAGGVALLGTPHILVEELTDKYLMPQRLARFGVVCPPTYLAAEVVVGEVKLEGPIIVKPRTGRGSRGLERLVSAEHLGDVLRNRSEEPLIVQPQIGGQEFGMDVVNDLSGRFRGALVRHKLRMRNGETDRAETVLDDVFVRTAERIAQCTQHLGVFDVDLMMGPGGPLVIDINPRFGGGYMFNHAAGANVPAALVGWLDAPEEHDDLLRYEAGVVAQRLSPVRRVASHTTHASRTSPHA